MKQRLYEFAVTGKLTFPLDMLRYDCCYPAGSEDAAKIENSFDGFAHHKEFQTIKLIGQHRPTEGRWSSFSWSVDPKSIREI